MVRGILSRSSYVSPTHACRLWKQQSTNSNVRLIFVVSSLVVIAEAYSQGISYERSLENGSLLRIPRSIIIPRTTSSTKERQRGSSRVRNSTSGRRTDRYCGSVAIVRNSCRHSNVCVNCFRFQRALERVYFGMWRPNDSRHRKLRLSRARQSLKTSSIQENREQP